MTIITNISCMNVARNTWDFFGTFLVTKAWRDGCATNVEHLCVCEAPQRLGVTTSADNIHSSAHVPLSMATPPQNCQAGLEQLQDSLEILHMNRPQSEPGVHVCVCVSKRGTRHTVED